MNKAISKRKSELMEQMVIECEGNQKTIIQYIIYLGVKRLSCCKNKLLIRLKHEHIVCHMNNIFTGALS